MNPESLCDFVSLVKAMRTAQRTYFRTRSPTALEEAKRLEKRADAFIKAWEERQTTAGIIVGGVMTEREAKDAALKVWRYFRDNPEISAKRLLPDGLYERIRFFDNECPLCELYFDQTECPQECPLSRVGCVNDDSPYWRWLWAEADEPLFPATIRRLAAAEMVSLIAAWDVGESV